MKRAGNARLQQQGGQERLREELRNYFLLSDILQQAGQGCSSIAHAARAAPKAAPRPPRTAAMAAGGGRIHAPEGISPQTLSPAEPCHQGRSAHATCSSGGETARGAAARPPTLFD